MTRDNDKQPRTGSRTIPRRTILKAPLAGAAALAAPGLLIGEAHAAGKHMDLESFKGASIDWRMAAGEKITVGVIPPPATSRTSRPCSRTSRR